MDIQHFPWIHTYLYILLSLSALARETVTGSDGQDCVMAAGAVSAQDGNAERFCLHCRTTHTLLLHSSLLQGVDGLTATFTLRDRQIDMGLWLHWMACDSTHGPSHRPHNSAALSVVLTGSHPLWCSWAFPLSSYTLAPYLHRHTHTLKLLQPHSTFAEIKTYMSRSRWFQSYLLCPESQKKKRFLSSVRWLWGYSSEGDLNSNNTPWSRQVWRLKGGQVVILVCSTSSPLLFKLQV